MQTIIPSHGNTLKILGKPKKSENGYRFMTYVMEKAVDEGYLLFHVLTREFLLLTSEEYENRKNLPELYEKWFLVPEDLDDMKYADQVRFIRRTVQKRQEHITNYTIFTTTDCNARCFYCYEMGRSRIPMSEETAHKAAEYIIKHCGKERVKISWFGGEPLFNQSVIDIICSELAANDIEYSSSMISNAYLFDDSAVRKAADIWKLKNVQITLDGTEEVYNRSKAYIYRNDESPYRIVLSNIERLLDADISVVIRMNLDRHNADNLMLLADELHERFPDRMKLSAYSHVLFEFSGSGERIREDSERRAIYEKHRMLTDKLVRYGLKTKHRLRHRLPINMCMADSGHSRSILPNGELGLCEHYSEDHFIGHISDENIDTDMVRLFGEAWEKQAECASCVCYPECIRLKMCQEQARCFAEMQNEKKINIYASMQYTYEMWKNKQEEQDEMCSELC